MRTVIVSAEQPWYDALAHALGKKATSLEWISASTIPARKLPMVQMSDVTFICCQAITAHTVKEVETLVDANVKRLIILVSDYQDGWAERIYEAGAYFVLQFPIRPRYLDHALSNEVKMASPLETTFVPLRDKQKEKSPLQALRDHSRLLSHAPDGPAFLRAYMSQLREVLRASRLLLYTRDFQGTIPLNSKTLPCTFYAGVDEAIFANIRLSLTDGLGLAVTKRGYILSAEADDVPAVIKHEMNVLGAIHAIPVVDKDGIGGILLLGPRISGLPYDEEELTLVFHLMEELGAASRNSRYFADLTAEKKLFTLILSKLGVGCMIVSPDLRITRINEAFNNALGITGNPPTTFENLPAEIASLVYGVTQNRIPSGSYTWEPLTRPGEIYHFTATPIYHDANQAGNTTITAMVVAEDQTQMRRDQTAAVFNERSSLFNRLGAALSNELNNAIMQLNTIAQLPDEEWTKQENVSEFKTATKMETRRVKRSAAQLLRLSRPAHLTIGGDPVDVITASIDLVGTLSDFDKTLVSLDFKEGLPSIVCDKNDLAFAFFEIILNGLQVTPIKAGTRPKVTILISSDENNVSFSFRDTGTGFLSIQPDSIAAFSSTKARGVGLGLTIVDKIIREHRGNIAYSADENSSVTVNIPITKRYEV